MKKEEVDYGIRFSCATSLIAMVVYPLMITNHGYNWWNYLFEMSFGLLFIVSYTGIYFFIRKFGDSFFNLLALIFHIVAGTAVLLTNVMQKSVFTIGRGYSEIENAVSKEIVEKTYQLGNLTQLAIDYYFDLLVSTATIFLSLALLRQTFYYKWISILGLLVGIGGILINTVKFPIPPANAGLFDPGPYFAAFTALIIFPMIYQVYFKNILEQ